MSVSLPTSRPAQESAAASGRQRLQHQTGSAAACSTFWSWQAEHRYEKQETCLCDPPLETAQLWRENIQWKYIKWKTAPPKKAGMNKGTFIMLDIFLLWTFCFVQSHGCLLDPPPPCPLCHSHAINHSIFCLASNSAGPLAGFRNKMQTLASWLALPSPLP